MKKGKIINNKKRKRRKRGRIYIYITIEKTYNGKLESEI
jgi:hypothetical protein